MNQMVKPKRRIIKDLPVGHINITSVDWKEKALAAEPTGKGNLLCIDGFFGRMFRSCAECVDDELNEYVRMYNESCIIFTALFHLSLVTSGEIQTQKIIV